MTDRIRKQILLTNDDGIDSPGLWAAAQALSTLGYVTVAAPRDQASSTGRSLPISSDGRIALRRLRIGDQEWPVYAVGGTPAQVVLHTVLEIMPQPPDLVVSGINYGENVGTSITISGTVGAALEGASLGFPALAMSLQMRDSSYFYSHSADVDFSAAAYFTAYFARLLLEKKMPADVDALKVDVPYDATPQTDWDITRLARDRYYVPYAHRTGSLEETGSIRARLQVDIEHLIPKTDLHCLLNQRKVSVTPLSLDMTSRVEAVEMESWMRKMAGEGERDR